MELIQPVTTSPSVAIIILNWNGIRDTERCLASVLALDYPSFQVFVVDNGSEDGSLERLRRLEPGIAIIEAGSNLGYAGGNNLALAAIAQRSFDYVWLLNNDATTAPATLSRLVATAERDPQIGMVSPVIYDADERHAVQVCGARVDRQHLNIEQTGDCSIARDWQEADPRHFIVYGTAPLVRMAAIHRCGGFDEGYFAYWEDIEFALRLIGNGYRCVTDFDASVDHRPIRNSGGIDRPPYYCYYAIRNHYFMWRGHSGVPRRAAFWRLHLLRVLHFVLLCSNVGQAERLEACLAGTWAAWMGREGAWDGVNRMPRIFRLALTTAPWLLQALVVGDFRLLVRLIGRRLRIQRQPAD